MKTQFIDVSDLSPKQVAIIEEIIATFKFVAQQNILSQDIIKKKEKLEQLHQEFDWLVADIRVKEPINRSDIYGIK